MKKNIIIASLLILIVLGGVYMINKNRTELSGENSESESLEDNSLTKDSGVSELDENNKEESDSLLQSQEEKTKKLTTSHYCPEGTYQMTNYNSNDYTYVCVLDQFDTKETLGVPLIGILNFDHNNGNGFLSNDDLISYLKETYLSYLENPSFRKDTSVDDRYLGAYAYEENYIGKNTFEIKFKIKSTSTIISYVVIKTPSGYLLIANQDSGQCDFDCEKIQAKVYSDLVIKYESIFKE